MDNAQINFDFDLSHEERMILSALRPGKRSAILGDGISRLTGIQYDDIRAIISRMVNKGYLIASYSRGFYIPETESEITEATRSLRHRGIMILMRAARLQKTSVEKIFNQARIEFQETK
jgi:hypothetical protein